MPVKTLSNHDAALVSEELSSVETRELFASFEAQRLVSEELSSVETYLPTSYSFSITSFQKNLVVWKLG